jgi:cell division protein FtsI (penicillin-binding protein 3)
MQYSAAHRHRTPSQQSHAHATADAAWIEARRIMLVALALALVFLGIAGQLIRLALPTRGEIRTSMAEPVARNFSRPDIVDRRGRLIATDVAAPSLYADPALVVDLDDMVERLVATLPGLNEADLRKSLADRQKRFQWIKRGLTPKQAQSVHDLGLPALAFRQEPKRVYPTEALAGHIVGSVNVDNRGQSGIERQIDDTVGIDMAAGAAASSFAPVRLSIDLGVQHAVADELAAGMKRYSAPAAAGLVMDIMTGEIVAAVSLPAVDPNRPAEALEPARAFRLQAGVFELGSIFKLLTVAMALESGAAKLDKTYPTTRPIEIGRFVIKDLHPQPAPLSVRDIFIHSSNVGAGLMGLEAGAARQRAFLSGLGLLEPMRTEVGPVALPLVPRNWERIETVTIAYGHGLAVAPLQFAAITAGLLNGGHPVTPTFLSAPRKRPEGRLVSAATSSALRDIMRLNVTSPHGTGRRADVAGYEVGGKTGTAEIAGVGGYKRKSVISSFIGAMPMSSPRYLMLVSLFEPKGTDETKNGITAGLNAAPVTARIVERIAPILGLMPRRLQVGPTVAGFDATDDAK